jgi:hypothetical protein
VPQAQFFAPQGRLVSWNWQIENHPQAPYCRSQIPFCYTDAKAESKLKNIFESAVDMWKDALGPRAGVEFQYARSMNNAVPVGICYDATGQWAVHPMTVEVKLDDEDTSYSTVGYKPDAVPGEMNIKFALSLYSQGLKGKDKKDVLVATMAHEIGESNQLRSVVDVFLAY